MRKIILIYFFLSFGILNSKAQNSEIVNYENILFIENFAAKAGDKLIIPVYMNNTAQITGIQFDIELSEGFSIPKENNNLSIKLSNDRTSVSRHFVSATQSNNTYKVVIMSTNNKLFLSNSGCVAYISIDISSNIKDGVYPIILKNQKMSTTYMETYKVASIESSASITSIILGDINKDGKLTIEDVNILTKYLTGDISEDFHIDSADMNHDGKIGIDDVTILIDRIKP